MNPHFRLPGRLLFSWPQLKQISVLLPSMILLAALLHFSALLLFGLKYPEPHPGALRPATLTLLLPDAIPSRGLESWMESEDPSLFSPTIPDPAGSPDRFASEFTPTFDEATPQPLPLPASQTLKPTTLLPDTGPVPYSALPSDKTNAPPTILAQEGETSQGSVAVHGDARRLVLPGNFTWPAREYSTPSPSVFLVAFLPDGTPASVFLSRSCGERPLDDLAASALKRSLFQGQQPSGTLQWATVSFFWDFPDQQVPMLNLPES